MLNTAEQLALPGQRILPLCMLHSSMPRCILVLVGMQLCHLWIFFYDIQ